MRFLVYILIGILLAIIFGVIVKNPMDDSGKEFNANIFPFEIKDPEDWYKSKDEESNSENEKHD
ncbi:hypothetical protein [Clostridium ganghwense]|uniref:Uncharacterized protein n=1 Tax=Clostridium ganghwense TaxID=312089 RepID=A0ABT4CUD8_9CLOT|nr:hypothetical protein [Clostridium ganghwense]MCY6372058.1 hypothetical protein [Clostridium ganghwense]